MLSSKCDFIFETIRATWRNHMTNESVKVLLMIMLLASLRTTIFITERPRSWLGHKILLDRLMAPVWSAMALPKVRLARIPHSGRRPSEVRKLSDR